MIPFEACPAMSLVEVTDESWGPLWLDRDLSGQSIWMNGTLRFTDNQTSVAGVGVDMYLVESNMTNQIPGLFAVSQHLVGSAVTDSNGTFNITGMPTEAVNPGNSSLVILTKTLDYVGSQGIFSGWNVNVTDDINLTLN